MSIKKKNLSASHTMELPRQIVVGEKNMGQKVFTLCEFEGE